MIVRLRCRQGPAVNHNIADPAVVTSGTEVKTVYGVVTDRIDLCVFESGGAPREKLLPGRLIIRVRCPTLAGVVVVDDPPVPMR